MLANTKTNPGGDLIIFAFNHNNSNTSSADMGEVNRLISTCATSRDSLEQLYIMFKSAVFAVAYGITSDYHLSGLRCGNLCKTYSGQKFQSA